MKILETKHLKKYYGSGNGQVKAVNDISISVEKGEFVAIVGTSGSGKTTLLNLLGGLDYADSGEVIIDGQSLLNMDEEARTVFRRRKIGFIFQNYNLVSMLDVYKNVVLPIRLDGNKPDRDFVIKVLELLGLTDKILQRPNQLSGGQQQRVAIARALASKPAIVLADEPTGNLDSKTSQEVIGLLQMSSREFHQTIIMITHNEEIAQMADRIIHIEDGGVVGGVQ
ncbi:Macrolide export ATP-binding/permease protein MacB [Blautia hydrogenotrophica]|uniref:ABC transporter ATP-binding protein n=1 Tax=Blautia hydrogenotrophica TaxID=53443 RepID=UPI0006C36DEA|nr:ABC transporter ATP-binding protein [Blautia hydrogenotrophica]CUM70368.1 Macrolide export ATP-binding/permease protein MacB [Blautia hydrogenotrophica]SCI16276.1 Macrolide export ATP-binding/permease protein MacB [uncultured Blautia sp.]